ncbi:MAG: sulfur carrier protein ThiS adenylyltransferase ThiF [Kiritimatiellae bacterium]|nr:sulfur carrier protein ThiS adenylyltransferase ThiF [Kiritimatiellia bacterium]MDD4737088.1 sulfur carrier protein ThiS adenylyltransferase ThiF [Kiritimatiellia bacterium]
MGDTASECRIYPAAKAREKLAGACVGVAGCGGLGSNAAMMLARAGVGCLILADFDRVETANLDRQSFFTRHVGMRKVEALTEVIGETGFSPRLEKNPIRLDAENVFEVFAGAKVILEAFDTVESKVMLLRAFADERFSDTCLVAASGLAGYGSSNEIRTLQLGERIYMCGDQRTDEAEEGILAPRVVLAAAHQANMVVRLICEETAV